MSDLSRLLIVVILIAMSGFAGFFGRGWYDGTLISRTDADLIAQGRADQSAKTAVEIERATNAKNAALRQLNAPRAPVSLLCPPGTGSVSDAAFDRFRAEK